MYEMGDYPDYDKSSWESVKDKIGFPLLKGFPYLIDGKQRKQGQIEVLNVIAAKYAPDLLGQTPDIVDEVISLTEKFKKIYDNLMLRCYCKKTFEELDACEYLKPVVEILEHSEFAAGPELTLVDF